MSYGDLWGYSDAHKVDKDSVTQTAYWAAINAFWKCLTTGMRLEAEEMYNIQSYTRAAYVDYRELAYNKFSHDLATSNEFKFADKLFDAVSDMVFDYWEEDDE